MLSTVKAFSQSTELIKYQLGVSTDIVGILRLHRPVSEPGLALCDVIVEKLVRKCRDNLQRWLEFELVFQTHVKGLLKNSQPACGAVFIQ